MIQTNLPMHAWTRRDLTIMPVTESDCLVLACDSCGAIGLKPGDLLRIAPHYQGKHTSRVALTEVMCSGALPVVITNGVSCEMEPTGREVIRGIRGELADAGLTDVILTGSTEENFASSMTALAITVIGRVKKENLRFCKASAGDKVILLGTPKIGVEVDLDGKGFYEEIDWLLGRPDVKELVPVGSKGILYECQTLAALSDRRFMPYDTGVDYLKSAGPATCLLILCTSSSVSPILAQWPGIEIGEIQ